MRTRRTLLELVGREWAQRMLDTLKGSRDVAEAKTRLENLKKERKSLAEQIAAEFTGERLRARLEEAKRHVERVRRYVEGSGYRLITVRGVVEEGSSFSSTRRRVSSSRCSRLVWRGTTCSTCPSYLGRALRVR